MRKLKRNNPQLGAISTGSKGYGTSGTGWDMPAGATIVGYTRSTGTSQRGVGQDLMLPRWVAAAPAPAPAAPAPAPNINVSAPVNVSTPITTQTTTAVSPVLNVAAGSQGVTQGASTDQQASPTSSNQTPQGNTATGLSPEQVRQMLEQQTREQDALTAQKIEIARKEALYDAMINAEKTRQEQADKYRAEITALQAANQRPTIDPAQQAPIAPPVSAPVPAVAVAASDVKTEVPVIKDATNKDVLITAAPAKNTPWLMLALAAGGIYLVMSGNRKHTTRKRRAKK